MAWTAPRTWTDGELVTKAIMDVHVRDDLISTSHVQARKTADETVNNSSAFQSDDHLFFSVAANEIWATQWFLRGSVGASSTPDIKYQWTFPSGTAVSYFVGPNSANTLTNLSAAGSASPLTMAAVGTSASSEWLHVVSLTFVNGATPGTLQLQWAQDTATAVDTKLLTGACVLAARVT